MRFSDGTNWVTAGGDDDRTTEAFAHSVSNAMFTDPIEEQL